jgi:hypothetical protein
MYVINYPFETDSLSSLGHFQSCVCVCVASPPAPPLVQLHCIHCALKTLAGPGEELKMDDEVFVTALRLLVKEILWTALISPCARGGRLALQLC